MLRTLGNFVFRRYDGSSSSFGQSADTMGPGSVNVMISGTGKNTVFRGIAQISGPLAGGKAMFNVSEDHAQLGAYNETGIGSVFRVLGAWFFIGAGTLYKNGVTTSASASTTLQIKKVTSGALGTTYQAGSAQPSAPTLRIVTPPAGYTGKNDGVVSARISRIRAATGSESNASLSSNVGTATTQSVALTFPSADANGQDYWGVYVSRNGEGAVGNHYFLQEIPESVIAATTTSTVILDGDTTVNVPNSTLTSAHIGWTYRVGQTESITAVVPANITTGGNARCVVTAAGMSGSPKTVTFAVALNDTAAQVAGKARVALAADASVGAFFNVGGEGAEIIITAKTIAANDATMNFTLEDVTSDGITDDASSTDVIAANDTQTYITAVGANDSGGAGYQQITLAAASGVTGNAVAILTRAVDGTLRTYVFEWRDADLAGGDLAPSRNYPPPAAIFGGATGDVVFVDGALGDTVDVTRYARDNSISSANTTTSTVGNAIAFSDPAKPESFPPDNYVFTGDAPTCVLQGGNGIHWRFSRNSLGVIRYVGGSPAGTYERIWSGIGVQNQNHAVLGAGGRLYAYTGQRGLVRLGVGGEPDTEFASPVHEDMASFTASRVVLGYDANQQYVLVCHGTTILAFHEPSGEWCAPLSSFTNVIILGGVDVKSAITYQGNCYLSIGAADDSTALTLYNFNSHPAGLTISATAYTPWVLSDGVSDIISRIHVAVRAQTADITSPTAAVYINGDTNATSSQTLTIPTGVSGQLRHTGILRPNVRSAKSWRIGVNISTTSPQYVGFEGVRVEGETSGIQQ